MIHAIPFKVVHPCPHPHSTALSFRHFYHLPLSLSLFSFVALFLRSSRFLFSLFLLHFSQFLSPFHAASFFLSFFLAYSLTYIYICTRARTQIYAIARIIPLLALFLRVTTQWRCHTLSPSSNQCYCFTVPLLLLFLIIRSVMYRFEKYFKYIATRCIRI